MSFWSPSLKKLNDRLAILYPTKSESLRPIQEAGLDLSNIVLSDKALDNWFSILREAKTSNRISALVENIIEEKSDAELAAAYEEYKTTSVLQGGVAPTRPNFTTRLAVGIGTVLVVIVLISLVYRPGKMPSQNVNTVADAQAEFEFKALAAIQTDFQPGGVALSSDGAVLAVGALNPGEDRDKRGEVRLWRLRDRERLSSLFASSDVGPEVAFNPRNDNQVAAGGNDGQIRLWALDDPTNPITLSGGHNPSSVLTLAFSPDGENLASASFDSQQTKIVSLWQLSTRTRESSKVPGELVAINADNASFVMTDPNNTTTKTLKWAQIGSTNPTPLGGPFALTITCMGAFSRDARIFATGVEFGPKRGVSFWRDNGYLLGSYLPQSESTVQSVAFSPDGRLLAIGWFDGRVEILRTEDRQRIAPLSRHNGTVIGLAFSGDGKWLASSGVDRNIQIWEIISKK